MGGNPAAYSLRERPESPRSLRRIAPFSSQNGAIPTAWVDQWLMHDPERNLSCTACMCPLTLFNVKN
jgi:hypothetical protein